MSCHTFAASVLKHLREVQFGFKIEEKKYTLYAEYVDDFQGTASAELIINKNVHKYCLAESKTFKMRTKLQQLITN